MARQNSLTYQVGVLLLYPSLKHNLQRLRNVLKLKRLGGLKQPPPGPNKCSQTPVLIGLTALMGTVHSEAKAMRLGSLLVHAHNTDGHFTVLYVDDFTGVDPAEAAWKSASDFDSKLRRLNIFNKYCGRWRFFPRKS